MPHTDYEALEARCQAWRDRRADSDDSTDEEENEVVIENSIKASIRHATTTTFQRVLMFNQGAVESLYDDQMITTIEIL